MLATRQDTKVSPIKSTTSTRILTSLVSVRSNNRSSGESRSRLIRLRSLCFAWRRQWRQRAIGWHRSLPLAQRSTCLVHPKSPPSDPFAPDDPVRIPAHSKQQQKQHKVCIKTGGLLVLVTPPNGSTFFSPTVRKPNPTTNSCENKRNGSTNDEAQRLRLKRRGEEMQLKCSPTRSTTKSSQVTASAEKRTTLRARSGPTAPLRRARSSLCTRAPC